MSREELLKNVGKRIKATILLQNIHGTNTHNAENVEGMLYQEGNRLFILHNNPNIDGLSINNRLTNYNYSWVISTVLSPEPSTFNTINIEILGEVININPQSNELTEYRYYFEEGRKGELSFQEAYNKRNNHDKTM